MQKKERISLQSSEAHVFRAAAQIYAAQIAAGSVKPGSEKEWLEKCLAQAIYLAQRADTLIQSDDEISGGLGGSGGGLRPSGGGGSLGLRGD